MNYNNLIFACLGEDYVDRVLVSGDKETKGLKDKQILSRDAILDAPDTFKVINLKEDKLLLNINYVFSILAPSKRTGFKTVLNLKTSMDDDFDLFDINIPQSELSFFDVLKNLSRT